MLTLAGAYRPLPAVPGARLVLAVRLLLVSSLAVAYILHKIDQFGLHYIEQPLHWDDLVDHADCVGGQVIGEGHRSSIELRTNLVPS